MPLLVWVLSLNAAKQHTCGSNTWKRMQRSGVSWFLLTRVPIAHNNRIRIIFVLSPNHLFCAHTMGKMCNSPGHLTSCGVHICSTWMHDVYIYSQFCVYLFVIYKIHLIVYYLLAVECATVQLLACYDCNSQKLYKLTSPIVLYTWHWL